MDKPPQKTQEDLVKLSRQPIVNQLHSLKDSLTKHPPRNNMHGLVIENKLTWALKNLAHLGNNRYPYQVYADPAQNNGIFKLTEKKPDEGPITIALLSDWASATEESIRIAHLVGEQDYSIHLGDTYYVGNSKEISDNFNDTYGGAWPYGKYGSFAMLGNHEMYSSGKSYFTELLPYMGIYGEGPAAKRQEASFFCLENDYWRIIGLDTGYDSLTGILGLTPNRKLQLHEKLVQWLQDTVQPAKDNRGIILLTHHTPYSAFEADEFQAILPQLLPILGDNRTVIWICGHEHRLAIYGQNRLASDNQNVATSCFLRCIGHGGMPVETHRFRPKNDDPTHPANRNLVLYDRRIRNTLSKGIDLGFNGYVIASLHGPHLELKYYDDNENDRAPIVEESWTIDLNTGNLTGQEIKANPNLTQFQHDIDTAIGRSPD